MNKIRHEWHFIKILQQPSGVSFLSVLWYYMARVGGMARQTASEERCPDDEIASV